MVQKVKETYKKIADGIYRTFDMRPGFEGVEVTIVFSQVNFYNAYRPKKELPPDESKTVFGMSNGVVFLTLMPLKVVDQIFASLRR